MSNVFEKSEQRKKMKVLIFGATGSIGRELVEQALAKGYAVTVFTRKPENVDLEHADATVAKGDVMGALSVASDLSLTKATGFLRIPETVEGVTDTESQPVTLLTSKQGIESTCGQSGPGRFKGQAERKHESRCSQKVAHRLRDGWLPELRLDRREGDPR